MDSERSPTLLLVDDDETILRLFATALSRDGFDVVTATTGREGLRLAAESTFDLALVDVRLPDLSGVQVMRQILRTTSTIVILISGDSTQTSLGSALEQGAADFIEKPVRLPDLTARIRQALQRAV